MSQQHSSADAIGDPALEAALQEADTLLNAGNLIEAERSFRQILRAYPDNAAALRAMGWTAEKGERREEALDYYSRAIQLAPDNLEYLCDLSRIYLALGDQRLAEHYARQAVNGDSQFAMAAKVLGDSLAVKQDFEDAEKCYRQAIKLNPDFAQAYNNLGNILNQSEKLDDAQAAYLKALELDPDLPQAHSNLGILLMSKEEHEEALNHFNRSIELQNATSAIYRNMAKAYIALGRVDDAVNLLRSGISGAPSDVHFLTQLGELLILKEDLPGAIEALAQSIELNPALAKPHVLLANAYARQDDLENAIIHGRQAVEIEPNNAAYHTDLGVRLQLHGARDDAAIHYERALAIDAEFVKAKHALGTVREQQGDDKAAMTLFQEVLKLDENYYGAYANIGLLMLRNDRVKDALSYLKKALELDPESASANTNFAIALQEAGDYSKAEEHYLKSVEINPDMAETHASLGVLYQQLGRLDESAECYSKALTLREDFPEALFALSFLESRALDADMVERMQKLSEHRRLTENQRSTLYFAIGKSLDEMDRVDEAFEYIRKGNEIERAKAKFSPEQIINLTDRIIKTFTPAFFERRKAFGSPSSTPILVVGMPRSGTTLVEQILSSHPRVFGAGELQLLGRMARAIPSQIESAATFPEVIAELNEPQCLRFAGNYLRALRHVSGGAERVTDKLPFNFFRLGMLALLFPNAKIIACRRDPRDIFVSGYFLKFRSPIPYTSDQVEFALFHQQFERLMNHWHEVLPIQIEEVVYEDMVADQEAVSRRIVDYCGLDWDDRCLEFYKTERPVKTGSNVAVRKPMYDNSVQRWRRFESHLGPLIENLTG